jgi:tRNA threonylcarbamoyladenosine biosynthesis protein TsaB
MALILSLETSTYVCSIALHRDNELLTTFEFYLPQSHSNVLATSLDFILNACGIKIADLSAVAISMGPGSYTGLRIGTSTAKGFCYAMDIPLIAVGTLEAMCQQVIPWLKADDCLVPMIDARRMEVYTMIRTASGKIIEPVCPKVIDESTFDELSNNAKLFLFGNGMTKFKDMFKNKSGIHFIDDIHPLARNIGELAYQKLLENDFEDLETFEPFYLKEFYFRKPNNSN